MKHRVYKITLSTLERLAIQIVPKLRGGEIFALIGELGAGKTTFVKTVVKILGSKKRVTSPTFTLMNMVQIKPESKTGFNQPITVYHLDLYRTKSFREVAGLGITEVWGKRHTITFIEWADKIKKYLPKKTKFIYFTHETTPKN